VQQRRQPALDGARRLTRPAAATLVEPALTTMRNPIEQTALEALRILDDKIAGRVHQPVHLVTDP
jgi:DNA-binding LacI/PurR family transcriptional regulator